MCVGACELVCRLKTNRSGYLKGQKVFYCICLHSHISAHHSTNPSLERRNWRWKQNTVDPSLSRTPLSYCCYVWQAYKEILKYWEILSNFFRKTKKQFQTEADRRVGNMNLNEYRNTGCQTDSAAKTCRVTNIKIHAKAYRSQCCGFNLCFTSFIKRARTLVKI